MLTIIFFLSFCTSLAFLPSLTIHELVHYWTSIRRNFLVMWLKFTSLILVPNAKVILFFVKNAGLGVRLLFIILGVVFCFLFFVFCFLFFFLFVQWAFSSFYLFIFLAWYFFLINFGDCIFCVWLFAIFLILNWASFLIRTYEHIYTNLFFYPSIFIFKKTNYFLFFIFLFLYFSAPTIYK